MTALPSWTPARPQRLGAAVLAFGVTASFLATLRLDTPTPTPTPTPSARRAILVLLMPVAAPIRVTPAAEPGGQSTGAKSSSAIRTEPGVQPRPLARPPIGRPVDADTSFAETPRPIPAPTADVPSPPSPLRLEIGAEAARAAKGPVRSMADAAGTSLGDASATSEERRADAVAKAAKADCLAANPNGSLLSVAVIAYEAATGKCR